MVILAIVVLVMTNVLVTSTKSHSGAVSEDMGDMLALEKLAELQNHVIPAKSSDPAGEVTTKDHTDYTIVWVVDEPTPTSTTPPQAKVTVTWTGMNGIQEQAEIVGYIDIDNACPDPAGNTSTNGINFMWDSNNDGTITVLPGSPSQRVLTLPVQANTPIAILQGDDAELAAGMDQVQMEFTSGGALANKYYLVNDTLKNRIAFATPVDDDLEFKITDCANNEVTGINFTVVAGGPDIPVIGSISLPTIEENETTARVVSLTSTGGTPPIVWSLSGAPQGVTVTAIDDHNAELKIVGVNHEEVNGKARFTVFATDYEKKAGEAQCELTVQDVNDAPEKILLSNTILTSDSKSGDVVGIFSVKDEDDGSYSYEVTSPIGSIFHTSVDQLLLNATPNSASYTITVKVIDGSFSREDDFIITLSDYTDLCSTTEEWSSNKSYGQSTYVKHGGMIYKAMGQINAHVIGQPLLVPGVASQWELIKDCN